LLHRRAFPEQFVTRFVIFAMAEELVHLEQWVCSSASSGSRRGCSGRTVW
jgi:hypothetical protein